MSLLHVNYFSEALQKQSAMFLVLPDKVDGGPWPVVYLLHGLSDDYTIWQRRTSVERYAKRYGMIVAMPDGARGYYTDAKNGFGNYERHIIETVAYCDHTFKTIAAPRARGIGGLSMGGFGALKLGFKHPELFGSVTAHSSFVNAEASLATALSGKGNPLLPGIFGNRVDPADDVYALSARTGAKPALRFDCGTEDFLIQHNRDLHAHLTKLGVAHEYQEFAGAHTWEYWDEHIDTALRFHRRHFDQV